MTWEYGCRMYTLLIPRMLISQKLLFVCVFCVLVVTDKRKHNICLWGTGLSHLVVSNRIYLVIKDSVSIVVWLSSTSSCTRTTFSVTSPPSVVELTGIFSHSADRLFIDSFLCSTDVSQLDVILLVYFCFNCLCFWNLFQEVSAYTYALQGVPGAFPLVI